LRTKLCDELGIELPIFAFTHCRDVVAAVSKAGGFGVLGAVGFSAEQLESELRWIDENVGDKPYGVDTVIPNKYEGMGELDPEKLEEQPPGCWPSAGCRSFRRRTGPTSCWAGPWPPRCRRSRPRSPTTR
jgi:NAD(P)H-dependent flavin oxidoreductase YrpB (nitropropane dioxygenase family)